MKKTLIKVFLFTGLIIITDRACSQDIYQDTIRWTATGFNDVRTNLDRGTICHFITYKQNKIEWIQSDGKIVYEMPIRKMAGKWDDVKQDGIITYGIELNKVAGRMIIQRSRGQVRVTLAFDEWSGGPVNHRYYISNIEIIQ